MKKIALALLISFTCLSAICQDFNVPEDVVLVEKEDYKRYESDVLAAIQWMQETPLNEQTAKRKDVGLFFMKWITGSPTVTIEISEGLVPFMEHGDCLVAFMAGWTKYSLENDYAQDKVDCGTAAIEHTIAFYQKNKAELGKISSLEKLIKKQKKGQLKKYVKENV